MKKFLIVLLVFIFNFQFSIFNCPLSTCAAQQVLRERRFEGAGLYGFMNGGADQFLEYGVKELVARDIVYEGEEYSVEIYEMPSPEEAFGIYSLHTFRCQRADTLGCIDCLSPYQLQAVSANYYVSVVFPSGSNKAKKAADDVLRMYAPMDADNALAIPDIIKDETPYSGKLKYLKGPLSVSTANFALSQLVQDIPYTGIWFILEKPSKNYKALIYVSDTKGIEKIKERVSPENILYLSSDYIYISGKEKDDSEDYGTFGF